MFGATQMHWRRACSQLLSLFWPESAESLHSGGPRQEAKLCAVLITALTVSVISKDLLVRVTVASAGKLIEGNSRGVALIHTQATVVKETNSKRHHPEAYSRVCTQTRSLYRLVSVAHAEPMKRVRFSKPGVVNGSR
jgi:hypothetical protein